MYIGSQPAEVTSFTDTQIVVEVDSVDAGEQMVKVETADGFATNVYVIFKATCNSDNYFAKY